MRALAIVVAVLFATSCAQSVVRFPDCADGGGGCPEGQTLCGAACVTLKDDPKHCGGCGLACATGESCLASQCLPADCGSTDCSAAQVCQADRCVDKRCVPVHCPTGQSCFEGQCYVEACGSTVCTAGSVCQSGACVDVACAGVTCPPTTACARGQCLPVSQCAVGVTCTPANGCHAGATMCTNGVSSCADLGTNVANGTSCGTGQVCSAGTCTLCGTGVACNPANACKVGATACTTGAQTCVETGADKPNGTSCGQDKVCSGGACVACVQGQSCTPTNACHTGTVACATGSPVCMDTGANVGNGTACGSGMVCSGGACVACAAGGACAFTGNVCHAGVQSCASGAQACVDSTTAVADGTACGGGKVCLGGACGNCTADSQCTAAQGCYQGTCTAALKSCQEIKTAFGASAVNGLYRIDPDGVGGADPFAAKCNMAIDGGGWTRFHWVNRAWLAGEDPFDTLLKDCLPGDLICRGRIPASVNPVDLLIFDTTHNAYAAWKFNGGVISNAVLAAMRDKALSCITGQTAFQPYLNVGTGAYCGTGGEGGCGAFYYTSGSCGSTGNWGMNWDGDSGFYASALHLGAQMNSGTGYACAAAGGYQNHYAYLNTSDCQGGFGELYYR